MRLIDADLLKENCKCTGKFEDNFFCVDLITLAKVIDAQPTAYDVDKVIEQLEKLKKNYMKARDRTYCRSTETDDCDSCRADHYLEARLSAIDRAIEIMKGGGVNE